MRVQGFILNNLTGSSKQLQDDCAIVRLKGGVELVQLTLSDTGSPMLVCEPAPKGKLLHVAYVPHPGSSRHTMAFVTGVDTREAF